MSSKWNEKSACNVPNLFPIWSNDIYFNCGVVLRSKCAIWLDCNGWKSVTVIVQQSEAETSSIICVRCRMNSFTLTSWSNVWVCVRFMTLLFLLFCIFRGVFSFRCHYCHAKYAHKSLNKKYRNNRRHSIQFLLLTFQIVFVRVSCKCCYIWTIFGEKKIASVYLWWNDSTAQVDPQAIVEI